MNTNTQDRLKAFLGRNRARVSAQTSEKDETFPLDATSANDDNKAPTSSRLRDNNNGPLSSRFPTQNQTISFSNVFGMAGGNYRVNYTEGYEYTEEGSPQRQSLGETRTSSTRQKSFLSRGSPMRSVQRSTMRNEMTPVKSEVISKRNNSTSPIRETRTPNKNMNMIESYVSGRKKVNDKIRDHLKSLSRDNKKATAPAKSNSLSLNYQSSFSRHQLGITSDAMETQESLSSRNHNRKKTSVREQKSMQAEKVHDKDKSKKHNISQRQPSSVFSSGVKKTKEERHEYVFEEARKVNKGNKTTRDMSRSMSRSISPTPKTVVKKDKKVEKSQQVTQRQTVEKSPSKATQQSDELFPESTKKLKDLDTTASSESRFKKEIQKLIEIIKSEKEHITKNMESMSNELLKYKTAYKKLKKKYQHQKEKKEATATPEKKVSSNNENILTGAEEGEAQNSFQGTAQYSSTNGFTKALSIKKHEENYVPFTIGELNKHLDSNIPVINNENPIELLSKMNDINLDVQNIISKNTQEENLSSNRDSNYNSNFETHSFQLRRNPINCYIIKEMNLASHLFFQDALKEIEQDADFTPTVIDLLAAQREIIHFLIRKIEIEEKQRLKTEDQTHQMIAQMEKTIKQLEERGPGSRKRESTSTTELNKSTVSQNAS